jgi:general secretion pathway protein K
MVASIRSEVQVAVNLVSSARAEAAADAGVFQAILALSRPATDPQQWQGNGLAHEWSFDGVRMTITIIDEGGFIDLNAAPESLFAGLFRSIGLDEATADSIAEAIADWRDTDDLRRAHGAERDDYVASGSASGPRNANFESVEELKMVLGVSPELFQQVAPLFTISSGQAGVDSSVAPRGVLMAFPGATLEQVDTYIAQREDLLSQGLPAPVAPFAQSTSGRKLGNTFTVQVRANLGENTTRFFREAVVQLTRDPKEPVVILAWRAPPTDHTPYSANETNHSRDGQ